MKIVKAVILATVFVLLPAYAFCSTLGSMHISLMEGDVQIKPQEAEDWGLAAINAPVREGDQLWVPEGGRLELQLNTGTFIRVDQDSALEILSTDENSSQFYLSQGHAYIYYRAPEGSVIQVDTPDASTRAFENAVFRIDIPDQYTDVAVYDGSVETENQVGITQINAGDMLSLGQDTNGEVSPMGEPDEWEMWNKERNDRVRETSEASSRYLPPTLREYAYDLDGYGRWVDVPEYGHCWTPKIAFGVNWAPYQEGRWIWIGGNYVWVADEPWGWAPYHYGRWIFVAGTGWCWVPPAAGAVYWGPGYVGWVRTADYVAWVPLAPGEIYYGRGYYGPHSENIININISRVRFTHTYRNMHAHNGVTVIERNTFATASPRRVHLHQNIIREKIFVKNNFSVGAPAIKPSKAGYLLSARPVPAAKLPPHRIRTLQIKELKHARPFIRERNKSVWSRGEKPKQLPLRTVTVPRTRGKGKPAIQPFRPAQGKSGMPEGGRTHGKEQHVTPPENRQIPGSSTLPGRERRVSPPENRLVPGHTQKQEHRIIPGERSAPGDRPARQEKRHIVAPPEKRLIPGSSSPPRKERRVAPPEKPFASEGRSASGEERRITPAGKRLVPAGRMQPQGERRIRPAEKRASPADRQQFKEEKKRERTGSNGKKKAEEPERFR